MNAPKKVLIVDSAYCIAKSLIVVLPVMVPSSHPIVVRVFGFCLRGKVRTSALFLLRSGTVVGLPPGLPRRDHNWLATFPCQIFHQPRCFVAGHVNRGGGLVRIRFRRCRVSNGRTVCPTGVWCVGARCRLGGLVAAGQEVRVGCDMPGVTSGADRQCDRSAPAIQHRMSGSSFPRRCLSCIGWSAHG
jgi:hypothetical protein